MNFRFSLLILLALQFNLIVALTSPRSHGTAQSDLQHVGPFFESNKEYGKVNIVGLVTIKNFKARYFQVYGPLDAYNLGAQTLVAHGPVVIKQSTLGVATITGPVTAEVLTVKKLDVTGPLEIVKSTVNNAKIVGAVKAGSSVFEELEIFSNRIDFEAVTIKHELVITSYTESPIVKLSNTALNCPITFIGKPGKIYCYSNALVDEANVTNGSIVD